MFYIAWGIFTVAVLFFVIFGIIIVYHLLRYRFVGDASIFMASVYIVVAVVILFGSTSSMLRSDWNQFGINFGAPTNTTPVSNPRPLFGD